MVNLHQEYLNKFPDRKIHRKDGKLTKNYKEWLEARRSPVMRRFRERELEQNKELKEWYQKRKETIQKQNKTKQRSKSLQQIQDRSDPKQIEKWLNGKG